MRRLADAALVVAGVAGALSAVWWVASAVLGLGLVAFSTGSMAPAHPAGSIAVAQDVPARTVRHGDVVTVDRGPQAMPVTHRVIGFTRDGDAALLTLQGDANVSPDPVPYRAETVQHVLFAVPGAGEVVRFVASAGGVALATLVLAAATTWVLWPPRSEPAPA